MVSTALFGRLPKQLVLWNQALERRLYREWLKKAPAKGGAAGGSAKSYVQCIDCT